MKRKPIESYLGFARRTGNVISGTQSCINQISHHRVKLILVASDASQNTMEKFRQICERNNVNFEIFSTMDELSRMTGMPGRGVFGITDSGFAETIMKEIQNEKIIPD